MATYAFDKVVAARTQAANLIHTTPDLLAQFVERGGLPQDLEAIVARGRDAEAANLGQSTASAPGEAATADVVTAFAALQREYKAVMAVARAVRDDLEDAGAPTETIEAIDQVLADETAVHVKVVKGENDASIKKALKSRSQEAVRAEIRKDAAALLGNGAISAALAARKVDAERLVRLRDQADALAGQLAARVLKKSERKAVTAAETAAVKAQRRRWGQVYRILASISDSRVQDLLRGTAR